VWGRDRNEGVHFVNVKNTWARGMPQVVECLPSKLKALNSNPRTTKKEKRKKK
jgi:hypothetical protein